MKRIWAATLVLAMSGCNQPTPSNANDNDDVAAEPAAAPLPAPIEPAAPTPDAATPARPAQPDTSNASLPETPIEERSAQAAGQVIQRYGALLEERRFADARRLWSDGGKASGLTEAEFIAAYDKYAEIHAEVGAPGDTEGAAGSIYADVPLRLYGTLKSGGRFNLVGPVSLRRINDVPGSTAEQRRWHIFQSGLKPRP